MPIESESFMRISGSEQIVKPCRDLYRWWKWYIRYFLNPFTLGNATEAIVLPTAESYVPNTHAGIIEPPGHRGHRGRHGQAAWIDLFSTPEGPDVVDPEQLVDPAGLLKEIDEYARYAKPGQPWRRY